MKIASIVLIVVLLSTSSHAQSFRALQALNLRVGQGEVLVFKIAPQYMPPATSNPSIMIFGKNYKPTRQGIVLVGVDLNTPPSKYIATFNEHGQRSGWDYEEIEVLETSFEKTRISSFTGEPNPRSGSQYDRIINAFGSKNQSEPDLTDGFGYINPLAIARDIIDPFGLIYENNPYRRHNGIDLRAKVGTEVRAVNGGRVVLIARNFRTEGNMIILNHGLGIFSVYMHLSAFRVKERDLVKREQVIALSGRSGAGAHRNPHLHFNIKIMDSYVDPLKFIDTVNRLTTP